MKLDQKDLILYVTARNAFNNNVATRRMLIDQLDKLETKQNILYGRLEMITDQIVDKYGLAEKNCQIEDDGTITEKT